MLPSRILLTITNKKRQKTPKTEYDLNGDHIIYIETIRRYLKWQIIGGPHWKWDIVISEVNHFFQIYFGKMKNGHL